MLKEITIKNFKSFKNETFFSMEASNNVSEHPNHLIKMCDTDLLKITSVYGPNGGGKTNLLFALHLFYALINYELKSKHDWFDMASYLEVFAGDINDKIDLSVFFIVDDYEIGYDVTLMKNTSEIVSFKVLNEEVGYRYKTETEFKTLFKREGNKVIGKEILELLSLKDTISFSDTTLFLNYIFTYISDFGFISDSKELHILAELLIQLSSITTVSSVDGASKLSNNQLLMILTKEGYKDKFLKFLSEFDLGIIDIRIDDEDKKNLKLFCIHVHKGVRFEIPYEKESHGTKRIMQFIPRFIDFFEKQQILLIDELDLRLHPKVTSKFIDIFTSNTIGSQVIFNSHDIINMKKELFRRDEIWFACLDDELSTELFSLSGVINYKGEKVRKDATYSKQYLEGKYGSDPFITIGFTWND